MKRILPFLITLLITPPVLAQLVVSPGIGYYSSTTEENGNSVESKQTRIDGRFGYILPMGLYLGGLYAHTSGESCLSGFGCADEDSFSVGPSIGYFSMMGFYTMFTYHIMGEKGDADKYTGAQGPQVDLGWVFPLTSYFSIGPQLTWRSIEYEKYEAAGVPAVDSDRKETNIAPYVSLWFMF